MTERPAEPKTGSQDTPQVTAAEETPQFQYVEEFVRHQLGSLWVAHAACSSQRCPSLLSPSRGSSAGSCTRYRSRGWYCVAAGRDPARSAAIDQVRRPSGHPNGDRRSDCHCTGRAQTSSCRHPLQRRFGCDLLAALPSANRLLVSSSGLPSVIPLAGRRTWGW